MRSLFHLLLSLVVVSAFWAAVAQQKDASKAPAKISFTAKNGNVTFEHKKHIDHVKGKCENCHPKLFAQSKEPIRFKDAMHKTAETKKSSCAGCHAVGGTAFIVKGNCQKCHEKPAAKT